MSEMCRSRRRKQKAAPGLGGDVRVDVQPMPYIGSLRLGIGMSIAQVWACWYSKYRLGEAVILNTGTSMSTLQTCRRRCRDLLFFFFFLWDRHHTVGGDEAEGGAWLGDVRVDVPDELEVRLDIDVEDLVEHLFLKHQKS